jgi:hypothetical protein
MLYFLILVAGVLLALFGVLAYGAINDGLRLLFIVMSIICSVCILLLGFKLVFQSDAAPTVAGGTPSILETPLIKAAPVRPAPPSAWIPAKLPPLAVKGTSFHLEPGQSSPLFRIASGKKAHVSVNGGSLTVFSGGIEKLSCEKTGFTISGRGDGNYFVACDWAVDVVIDDITD